MNRIAQLSNLGQSIWLDNIQRHLLENGVIKTLIDRGDIRGMTSNPTIFNQAISKGHDYDEALRSLAWAGWDAEKIFWELVVEDIRAAADLFLPVYEQTDGGDGYVSIEVSPLLAADTAATVSQAEQLWARVGRPNLMVKIPATPAGIPAIRRALAAGLNINITLIFSRARYAQVMEAYMSGLEDRVAAGHSIRHIASVASFFVSRVDSKVDARLPANSPLRGKAAIANARLAYDDFRRTFSGGRWERLRALGGRLQRPLWASTGTKDPSYPDTLYVDSLIGADTVNTLPTKTLDAARDHARTELSITQNLLQDGQVLRDLEHAGIAIEEVAQELEGEGVAAFSDAMIDLLKTIEMRRRDSVLQLGPLAESVAARINSMDANSVPARLWANDPTLWTQDPSAQPEVTVRMGWTASPQNARALLPAYQDFAAQMRQANISRFLVLGMGGSSLTAEVLSALFSAPTSLAAAAAVEQGMPACLGILDSTDPRQVAQAAVDFPPDRTLYFVASKSGGTAEVTALFDFFWACAGGDASRFVAITDESTSLAQKARQLGFRRVFTADSRIGGRYSAFTDFGMVPAALLGVDPSRFLDRADWMQRQCGRDVPAARSPGMALGALLGEAALSGRDKLTLVADDSIAALAGWIEQLVAESSGKIGRGLVPVPLEPLDGPGVYGPDRLFVYLRQAGQLDQGIIALRSAGFPTVVIDLADAYDAAAEFFRWEVAVAVACHILGVNAFDQPDVQQSKDRTESKIDGLRSGGELAEGAWDVTARGAGLGDADSANLSSFVRQGRAGDYVAINAYLPRRTETIDELQRMRVAIREHSRLAVTAGFGPRFQHSTGQLHKGGPDTGLFIQIVTDARDDLAIPGQNISFGTLIRAQALGDYETLVALGRRVLRVHLSDPSELGVLTKALQ